MDNKEYSIIREQGEYMEPVPLKPEESVTVDKSDTNSNERNKINK